MPGRYRQNGARTNERALPPPETRKSDEKALARSRTHLTRAGEGRPPLYVRRAPRRAATRALWNFCGTAFFLIDAIQTSRPPAAWRARKTFRRLPHARRIARIPKFGARRELFPVPRFPDPSPSHRGKTHASRALLGRIKLSRKLFRRASEIMPVLRRVTLSAPRNLARGKSHAGETAVSISFSSMRDVFRSS